ncbi:MAG: hypothetical protein AAFR11_01415 [Pseudomonadota bacterium]
MKLAYVASAAALGFSAMVSTAFANEVENHCEAFSAKYDTGYGGCACLGEKADADADLKDAILAIETPEDLDAAPDFVQAAIEECA